MCDGKQCTQWAACFGLMTEKKWECVIECQSIERKKWKRAGRRGQRININKWAAAATTVGKHSRALDCCDLHIVHQYNKCRVTHTLAQPQMMGNDVCARAHVRVRVDVCNASHGFPLAHEVLFFIGLLHFLHNFDIRPAPVSIFFSLILVICFVLSIFTTTVYSLA